MKREIITSCGFRYFVLMLILPVTSPAAVSQTVRQSDAKDTLRRVVSFYRAKVGYEGAYLWKYAADFSAQEGEGKATRTSGWTQPPGTPSVGEAFLKAWHLTGDKKCREAATEAAHALVRSQLESGGWSSHFDLGKDGRRRYRYRVDGAIDGRSNNTTFDDNKTQSAMMLLMHVDEDRKFQDDRIHEAVEYGLDHLLASQYPNGAWPQQFSEPPNASEYPVVRASYPDEWPREFPRERYIAHYTLNDNNMAHIIDMLFEAHRIYGRQDCYDAAVKTAEFFLLAQMPEPQPGWAQQYNAQMHPVWARKFEPPAVTGGESQSVMRKLIDVYRITGDQKFIEPLPRALAYYRKSQLKNQKLARFYELRTNRPLYFTKDYQLTHSDADMPTHYSFKVSSNLDALERAYQQVLDTPADKLKPSHRPLRPVEMSSRVARQATTVINALDSRGAWVENGKMRHQENALDIIDMRTFIKNLETLARYAGAVSERR